MSSKKKIPEKTDEPPKKPPIFQRKRFNLIYTIVTATLFVIGGSLIIIFQIFVANQYGFFAGLGIMGLSIILFTSRTTFKHSAPQTTSDEDEGEKDDKGLQMRRR